MGGKFHFSIIHLLLCIGIIVAIFFIAISFFKPSEPKTTITPEVYPTTVIYQDIKIKK